MSDETEHTQARKAWMSLLAKAPPARLEALVETLDDAAAWPEFTWLRAPKTGGVMVRGKSGGTGAAFNLGEMTVTRCALRLESGEVGHAYVQGRDKGHATRAARIDAMMQTERKGVLRAQVLEPLEAEMQAAKASRAAKAAATKVEFFTMVRGED
ncbi:phosphonate C-P lyase system protein PhnG [Rhodobacteraceae bacterium D3-12]|nr:phosphonate C-P lyase system protein PhnG [Rhodobacteraceae bacterium D3-12]